MERSASIHATRRAPRSSRRASSSWSTGRAGRWRGCSARRGSSTRCSGASPCPTRWSDEADPHHRQARAGQLFHLAGGLRVPGDLPAAHRLFHFHRRQFLRKGRSQPGRVLRLAPVAVPGSRAGGRHARVGRGAPLRHARTAADHADHALAAPGAGRDGRGILGGDAFRRLPARRHRPARPGFLPVGDRLRAVCDRHHHSRTSRRMKKYEHLIYSAVGLVALLLLLVAFNYLVSTASVRLDLTDGKLYTLSEGTRKILKHLSSPVKVKLYISQGEAVPVPLRTFAQRVEDLAPDV